MPTRFIDANVFLRHLTGDDTTKARAARALFLRLEAGTEIATTSSLVLFEVIFTLHSSRSPGSYNQPKERVAHLVGGLIDLGGLRL